MNVILNFPFHPEQRHKERIYEPFPATVFGVEASGKPFKSHAVLDNLSGGGLYLCLTQDVEQDTELSIVTRLSTAPTEEAPGALVAISGVVLRVEPQSDGSSGIAVLFNQHLFL